MILRVLYYVYEKSIGMVCRNIEYVITQKLWQLYNYRIYLQGYFKDDC